MAEQFEHEIDWRGPGVVRFIRNDLHFLTIIDGERFEGAISPDAQVYLTEVVPAMHGHASTKTSRRADRSETATIKAFLRRNGVEMERTRD